MVADNETFRARHTGGWLLAIVYYTLSISRSAVRFAAMACSTVHRMSSFCCCNAYVAVVADTQMYSVAQTRVRIRNTVHLYVVYR